MARRDPDGIVWIGEAWRPFVREEEGALTYVLPVESGFVSTSFDIPVTARDLAVLRQDRARYDALFEALHRPFQLSETRPDAAEVRALIDRVLHDL